LRIQRERERIEREHTAQVEYARKIAEENAKKTQAEKLISDLEREERELIERLRRAQELQQQVGLAPYFTILSDLLLQ
jgi:tRNA uridine 5-carbamoylmethylation protein Kti12